MKISTLPFLGLSASGLKVALESRCISQRIALDKYGEGYSTFNPVDCREDGTFAPRQVEGWSKKNVCVTPWAGQYRFEEDIQAGKSCDTPWVKPSDDQPCRQAEYGVMLRHEEAAQKGYKIADLNPMSCDEDGKFKVHQMDPMMGDYCVARETGEWVGEPIYGPDGKGDCSHPIQPSLQEQVPEVPALPDSQDYMSDAAYNDDFSDVCNCKFNTGYSISVSTSRKVTKCKQRVTSKLLEAHPDLKERIQKSVDYEQRDSIGRHLKNWQDQEGNFYRRSSAVKGREVYKVSAHVKKRMENLNRPVLNVLVNSCL